MEIAARYPSLRQPFLGWLVAMVAVSLKGDRGPVFVEGEEGPPLTEDSREEREHYILVTTITTDLVHSVSCSSQWEAIRGRRVRVNRTQRCLPHE